MSTITDTQLVTSYLSGDRSALAAIYDRYGATLYDTAAAMTGDRHDAADVVQDVFVVTAERLGQLRDPSRLKPWLFAILRNEVYRRTKRKRRSVATDFTETAAEMQLPTDDHDPASGAELDELAVLVRGAAAGLDERDQLVLELSVRQGLEGADLADALGVSAQQSYGLVHRMRQRTERSLAAFCVARRGRKECNELAKILHGWDEEFSVLVRKRVARHIDHCDICERTRRKVVPLALFAGAPAFAAPVGLRDRVLAATGNVSPTASSGAGGSSSYAFGRPGGFPSALRHLHKVALILIGTAALVLLGAGGAVYVLADGSEGDAGPASTTTTEATSTSSSTPVVAAPPSESTTTTLAPTTSTSTSTTSSTTSTTTLAPTTTTVAPTTTTPAVADPPPATTTTTAPGVLRLSAGTVDLGHTSTSATITLSNPGGAPLGWTATAGPSTFRGVASPFAIAPAGGQLAPGASVEVTVSVDRAWPTEGAAARSFTFAAPGTAARLDVVATIGRAPALRVAAPPSRVCQKAQVSTVAWTAYATDESQPVDVTLTVVPPNGAAVESPMAPDAGAFFASFDLDRDRNGVPDLGVFAWTVTATDPHGFAKTSSGTVSVGQDRTHCP